MKRYKRVNAFILLVCLLSQIYFIGVLAKDGPFIALDDEYYLDLFSGQRDLQAIYFEDGVMKFTFLQEATDPYLFVPLQEMDDIFCDDYPILAIKLKAPQPGGGSIYFATSIHGSLNEEKNVRTSEYLDIDDFQLIIVDFSYNEFYVGQVTQFRFDPYPKGVSGVMEIAWFGMFEDEDAARAFEPELAVKTPDPEDDENKIVITPSIPRPKGENPLIVKVMLVLLSVLSLFVVLSLVLGIIYLKKKREA